MTNEALREHMLSGGDGAGEEESGPEEGARAHGSAHEPCAKYELY